MGQFRPDEWEVIHSERIPEDMNYKVIVTRPCKSLIKKLINEHDIRTIRLPYNVRIGQLIECPKLT